MKILICKRDFLLFFRQLEIIQRGFLSYINLIQLMFMGRIYEFYNVIRFHFFIY